MSYISIVFIIKMVSIFNNLKKNKNSASSLLIILIKRKEKNENDDFSVVGTLEARLGE